MKIGVVSDTHNNIRNVHRIVELFNEARVERVIHTGDITQAKTLDVFAHLTMPLYGVYGNNDEGERESLEAAVAAHGFEFREPPFVLEWHTRSIMVVHDPLEFNGHLDGSQPRTGHLQSRGVRGPDERLQCGGGDGPRGSFGGDSEVLG
jgi:putative phosphoesterase